MCAQLVANSVSFSYGPNLIINNATFTVSSKDRLGIIGPNGTGKTTLLRLLCGELEPASGSVRTTPDDARVVSYRQVVDERTELSIGDWLSWRAGVDTVEADFAAASEAVAHGARGADQQYDRALTRLIATDPASFVERSTVALTDVGLGNVSATHTVKELSGGQRTRLQLAALRLLDAELLLLDEPTNDLDSQGLELLEETVQQRSGGLVVVSHDREFLSTVVTGVLELAEHDRSITRYEGGFDAWETERARARQHAEEAWDQWTSVRSDLTQRATRERQWSTTGVARHKKRDEPDKSIKQMKIERTEKLAGRAAQTERAIERHEAARVDKPWVGWELNLDFASVGQAGAEVTRADVAVVKRGEFELGPVSVVLGAGDRVLLQGPNGGGKTTLIDVLFGELACTSGSTYVGPGTVLGRMTQGRDVFGDRPLLEAFVEQSGLEHADARSQLAKLGLGPEEIHRTAHELSPGQQTRAILGLFAAKGVNTLILDEPTNHLDLEAIEQLEAALGRFDGTVLLITHDRRMAAGFSATRIWRVEHGNLTEH